MAKKKYGEQDIEVLKGLDPVRHRPGMYTNTENPHHIIQEVIDNGQDEALGGFASRIDVELHDDGSVSVMDNGRGIPVGMHPKEKKPTLEVVFTSLHSGGKFKKSSYGVTGGLHGVGVSVTNALSKRLEVTVWRDGYEHTMAFEGGYVVEKLKKTKLSTKDKKRTGTKVRAYPDPKYFDDGRINPSHFEKVLRSKAVLLKGVEVSWTRPDRATIVWSFPDGMVQYMEEQMQGEAEWIAPIFHFDKHFEEDSGNFEASEGFELVLGWSEGRTIKESYANLIPTRDGGRHETGLRAGLLESFRGLADRIGNLPKGIKIEADDIMSNMSFILSVKLVEVQFQNQTKDKMTSAKGHQLVYNLLKDAMELWLNDHPQDAKTLIDMVVANAVSRNRKGAKTERKRTFGASVLPGKLTDCESKDIKNTELFLVEGDSAGGSSKLARDKDTQAILPLRGKLLNTWDVDSHKAMLSDTISDISSAIGIDPHTLSNVDKADLSKLRYGKIFIMADADVDGQHIQVLLLTLFLRHFPALITNGHIWIARAPLYRVDAPSKKGSKQGPRKIYALDDDELTSIIKGLEKEGLGDDKYSVARFKGLGEMNPDQLKETTMNIDSRRGLKISLGEAKNALKSFDIMMNSKFVKHRKEWMEKDGHTIELD